MILAVSVVFWMVWNARSALFPFALGAVIAYLLVPLVDSIQSLLPMRGRLERAARPVAILLTYVAGIGVLTVAGFYLVPPLTGQLTEFIDNAPDYWAGIRTNYDRLYQYYLETVPEDIRLRIEENIGMAASQLSSALNAALQVTFGAVGTIIGFAAGLVLLPLWMFYVLKDQRKGLIWFYNLWPDAWQPDVQRIVGIIDGVLGAYIRVQFFLGIIIGVVTGIAMWLIGINQALALGLMAGVFELIPVLGPWLAFVAAALVTLATEPDKIFLVALAFLGIQQLENTFLVPKLQGDAVHLNPAVVMLLLVVGGSLWGVLGMIVIVPLTAVARDVFVYLYCRLGEEPTEMPPPA